MLRRIFILLLPVIFLFSYQSPVSGQGELRSQSSIIYRNERTLGFFLNSNGYGGDFSYASRINARNHKLYQVELMYLKHPKEVRLTNNVYANKTFIFGKVNSFFELKGQWGRQSEIYRKNDANGVSIRYFYSLGPTIGFLKPIYYEIWVPTSGQFGYTVVEKFTPSIHQTTIKGRASFLEGMDEISIIPGASAKFGFSFEYSKEKKSLGSIEFGAGVDLFPKNIEIMANESNQFFFINLFAGYRWGKVVDISDAAQAKRYRDRLRTRKSTKEFFKLKKKTEKDQDDFLP